MSIFVLLPTLDVASGIAALLLNSAVCSASPPECLRSSGEASTHSLFSQSLESHARCAAAERSVRRVASAYGP